MRSIIILFILTILLQISCTDNDSNTLQSNPDDNLNPNINFEMTGFPQIGGAGTLFDFTFNQSAAEYLKDLEYKIELDTDGNGIYDHEFSDIDSVKADVNIVGKRRIDALITVGQIKYSSSCDVIVGDFKTILYGEGRFIFEPHIYNSNKIIVTWGGKGVLSHRLQQLDVNGSYEGCIFCAYEDIDDSEMHCAQLSFDNTKIIWDTGGEIWYCDLTRQPLSKRQIYDNRFYEPGKVCWSMDSQKLFVAGINGTGVSYIDINDFSVSELTDYGEYLCAVPGKNDLIAIMEDAGKINSDSINLSTIKYFSISQNSVVEGFIDVPGFNSFRIIDEGRKVYIENPMCIYDLENKKKYAIDVTDVDLSKIQRGESDITMDGSKIIISIFSNMYEKRNLYSLEIPVNEL